MKKTRALILLLAILSLTLLACNGNTIVPTLTSENRIAFVSRRDGKQGIYTMSTDGTNQTKLTPNETRDDYPVWSPNGNRIAFLSSVYDIDYGIYVMNADGTAKSQIAHNLRPSYYVRPRGPWASWSPDGSKLAFAARDTNDEYSDIFIIDAAGSNLTRLTNHAQTDHNPAWSPDGTRIAYSAYRDGQYEIYVMDADGSNQTKISDHLNGSDSPSWSPDGSKIAYINMGWIWVVNADGSGRTNLHTDTTTGFSNSRPLWSPDGAKIAFVSNRDDNDEIYIMNADGSNEINLTNNPDYDKKHTWSPDGSKIAYISTTEDSNGPDNDIYVMNADGSNQTKLADSVDGLNPGSVSAPAWSP